MRNILKNSTNTIPTRLLSQQQILNLTQRLILKMIPPSPPHQQPPQKQERGNIRARISIQKRRCFNELFPIFTSFTFKRLMSLTRRVLVVVEQRPQITETEMSLHILRLQNQHIPQVL